MSETWNIGRVEGWNDGIMVTKIAKINDHYLNSF